MVKSTNPNDAQVLLLKRQVEEKKAALSASKNFNPKTNCSLLINGERINLRAESSKEKLVELLVQINSLKVSAENLGLLDDYRLCGYPVQDWVEDLQSRVLNVNRKQEEDRLKVLEARLHNLLSSDKKVELEIEELKRQI
jgi:hypothetical protein